MNKPVVLLGVLEAMKEKLREKCEGLRWEHRSFCTSSYIGCRELL